MLGVSAKSSWANESRGISFLEALWETLKPFPGRAQLTIRLALICTIIVLVADTFRLPFQDLMPFFILFVTKEEKVTTAISALIVLLTVTLAIAISIVLFKFTGDRAEFRIPAIAVEIFVGMYLFRVLALGPVGWILGFICAASQSLVYLFPTPEETVHQFLWLWVAIAFSVTLAWISNLLLFPVSASRLLQDEFVADWRAVAVASGRLIKDSPGVESLLRPLAERGPIRLLKLLHLSLIESPEPGKKKLQLTHLILNLDKITKLLFSYARLRWKSSVAPQIAASEIRILDEIKKGARDLQQQFEAGLVPSAVPTGSIAERAVNGSAFQLVEAWNAVADVAGSAAEPEKRPAQTSVKPKRSLLVGDAFTNPRHLQFALKVTLAGMIGYLFYTASDYYGIHTVFYTPLIAALASTGATIHKGFLRIVGCLFGGTLALICSIWVVPRHETLGTFLFIVFCLHGLAAWITFGGDRISYMGLQIALAFDLGFLQGYGPPHNIDPLRDRFIGIILGLCILGVVFSLLWPESADSIARERLAEALRAIGRLLRLGAPGEPSQNSAWERERLELEIASRLSEANSHLQQAALEVMLYGSDSVQISRLAAAATGVEEIYLAAIPWITEQGSPEATLQIVEEQKTPPELAELFGSAMDALANLVNQPVQRLACQAKVTLLLEKVNLGVKGLDYRSQEAFVRALAEFSVSVCSP
jgi:multidrug resistance protein MdtO